MRCSGIYLFFLLAACGSAERDLIGKWEFDPETFERLPFFRDLNATEQAFILGRCTGVIEFTDDTMDWNLFIHNWERSQWKGKYRVAAADGRRLTLEFEGDGAPKKKLVVTVTDGQLQFGLAGRSFLFQRPRPKKR